MEGAGMARTEDAILGTFAGRLVGLYPGVTGAQADVININFAVISGI